MKTTREVFYSNFKKFTGNKVECFKHLQVTQGYSFATDGYKLIGIRRASDAPDTAECINVEGKAVENVKPLSIAHLFPVDALEVRFNVYNIKQMLRFCKAAKALDADRKGETWIRVKTQENLLTMQHRSGSASLIDSLDVDSPDSFTFNVATDVFMPLLEVFKNFDMGQVLKVPRSGPCVMEYGDLFALCPVKEE